MRVKNMEQVLKKTKGQDEAEISEAIIKFEMESMGRGPLEAKTYIIDDLVLTRLKGVLTHAERQLAKASNPAKGRELIKRMRIELLEKGRPLLETALASITGKKIGSVHSDISTVTGEEVIIITLKGEPLF